MNFSYLIRRGLTLWKRTALVSDFIARRLLYRFLQTLPVLSLNDNVSPKPLVVRADENLLVLAPHSDDESIGCGGLLLSYPKQIEVVCLTDGSRADPNVSRHALIETREQELAQAMAIAGISKFRYLGIHDQRLTDAYERFSSLALSQMDVIFIPSFLDQHPDHKAVTTLLKRLLQDKPYKPSLRIAFYEVWSALPVWNAYVPLDAQRLAQKKALIDVFVSQTQHIDYAARISGLHTYRGIAVDEIAAEAYLILDVDSFLAMP